MKASVIVFPGSNCDRDAAVALEAATGRPPAMIWHGDAELPQSDLIVLPGGFSYGDYLRSGAMAAHSPVMREVIKRAKAGTPVLGICNGFQVLLEAGLLPGAMLRNRSLKYQCEHVLIKVEQTDTPFTAACTAGQVLRIPIAHGEGNYYADPDVIARLERKRQIVFRYTNAGGVATDDANPNGSVANIAGLCSEQRNVVGLMPHPERACEMALGSADGLILFESVIKAVTEGVFAAAR